MKAIEVSNFEITLMRKILDNFIDGLNLFLTFFIFKIIILKLV